MMMMMMMTTAAAIQLSHALLIMGLCLISSVGASMTCYNSTVYASPELYDMTVFRGAPTVECDDDYGCTKTLISKDGQMFGVSRTCGLVGCLGKSCFLMRGFHLCVYCCRKENCNSAGAVNSELVVLALSLVAGWLIRKQY